MLEIAFNQLRYMKASFTVLNFIVTRDGIAVEISLVLRNSDKLVSNG